MRSVLLWAEDVSGYLLPIHLSALLGSFLSLSWYSLCCTLILGTALVLLPGVSNGRGIQCS